MIEAIVLGTAFVSAVGGVLALAFKAISAEQRVTAAEKRAGEQKARGDALDVNLTSVAAQLADVTTKHKEERDRADRLDDALAQMVASVPVAGAYQRLLQIAAAAKAAGRDGDGARVVHSSAGAGHDADLEVP